jgi:hypothetical protein
MKRPHNAIDDHEFSGQSFSISTNEASLGSGYLVNSSNSISTGVVKALVIDNANKIRLADATPGSAATVTVGTTTTGSPGTSASVTNSGTTSAAVFNFTIPQGATGATGSPGTAATVTVGTTVLIQEQVLLLYLILVFLKVQLVQLILLFKKNY